MSQLPEGITTAQVHMDAPLSFIGEPGRLHVTVTPSATLVWAATGTPIGAFTDSLSLDAGQELRIELPHTDQPGFLDGNGNTFTGWFYTVEITYERDGEQEPFPSRDFQILSGQTDVDLALIPSGEAYVPQVAPIQTVTSWNGRTGAVVAVKADVGLDRVDNTNDLEKPISTAAQNALNLKAPLASPTFTGTVSGISKAMVGLGNVDNTADSAKPVSAAQQTALDLKAPKDSPTFTGTVTLPATTNGLSKSNVGLGNVDNTADSAKPVSTAQQNALNLKANLASPTFTGTVSGISKAMVGLGNVDNTSDLAKPISTLTQTALNGKSDTGHTHSTAQVTGLDTALANKADVPVWTAWTPVLTGITLGDGTVVARYMQVGKTVTAHITITLGSTSAVTGLFDFTIPVAYGASVTLYQALGAATLIDTSSGGAGRYPAIATVMSLTGRVMFLANAGQATNAIPFTWASGDKITAVISYEAA